MDLGSYEYVARVYNENMRIKKYLLPNQLENGSQTIFDDGLIKMTMEIASGRVNSVTIQTTNPHSTEYMQVFEGFEFGFNAVSTWIQNYEQSTSSHGHSEGIVKGMLASYDTTSDDVLTVTLTRVSGEPAE